MGTSARAVLIGAGIAAVLAPVKPAKAFQALHRSAGVWVLLGAVAVQVGAIFVVAESRPEFLARTVRVGAADDEAGKTIIQDALRAKAGRFASARSRRTLEDAVILWGFAAALMVVARSGRRTLDLTLAVALVGFVIVARGFATLRDSGWLDTGILVALAVAGGAYLAWRGHAALDALNAASLALVVVTVGFVVRQVAAMLSGRDAGRATLELLGSWNPAIAGWLARIDVFTLWWSLVLSAGVAIVTGRSYPLTAVLVTGVNVLLLLTGRGLIPS